MNDLGAQQLPDHPDKEQPEYPDAQDMAAFLILSDADHAPIRKTC